MADEGNTVGIAPAEDIEINDLIYVGRGQRVMLYGDLAGLYGVETKRINESVTRNLGRFSERFDEIFGLLEARAEPRQIVYLEGRAYDAFELL